MGEGVRAVQQSTPSERKAVLRRWAELGKTVEERKKRLQDDAVKVLEEEKQDGEVEFGQAAAAFNTRHTEVDGPESTAVNEDESAFENDMRVALERSVQDK